MTAQTGVVAWSQTASDNGNADFGVNYREGQAPSTLNDAGRALMRSVAKYRDDTAGSLETGGTTTAYTLSSNQVFASLTAMSGQELAVRFDQANGATPTLNVDSLGAKAININESTAVPTGFIAAGSIWRLTYDNSIPAFILNGVSQVQSVTSLTTTGSVTVGTDLSVAGDATVTDTLNVGNDLIVADSASVGDDLTVTDDLSVGGDLVVTGALKATGNVVQAQDATPYTANTQILDVIPSDDTAPTSSEGAEILTKAITPTSSSSKIKIRVDGFGLAIGTGATAIIAVFRGSTCIYASKRGSNGNYVEFGLSYIDAPATTSSTTYSVRIGATGAGAVYTNGSSTDRLFGGKAACTMRLEEIGA